ncbi:MAG: hypothetical protein OSB42_11365 [Planctomycetota bacterium]|nr:hypothetical protein [Planctomycetota bacterium]
MFLLSTFLTLTLPAMAPAQPLVAPAQDELFSFSMEPIESMLNHPKDAGLRRILELLPARIESLAMENGEDVPPGLIPMMADMMTSGKTLRIATSNADGPIPIQASFSISAANAEEASARNEYIMNLLMDTGAPLGEQMASGLFPLEAGLPMLVGIGTIGNDFVIAAGTDNALPRTIAAPTLPNGIHPDWQVSMQMDKLYEMIGNMGGEDAEMFSTMSSAMAAGNNMVAASGHDAEHAYLTLIQKDVGRMTREAGGIPSSGISSADLGLIPADAQAAILMKFNLEATINLGMDMAEPMLAEMGLDDPFAVMAEMTGLDLRADLLPVLGETVGFYMSDSTGGGTMASAVFFMELNDAEGMRDFMDHTCELIAPMMEEAQADGLTIGHNTFTADGVEFNSMTFPGLPIPVEPTYALLDKWLVFGLSPQATRAAVWQIRSGGAGLRDNPRFVEAAEALNASDSTMSLQFFDTPALLSDGYTWMNLLMSAAANGLRTNGSGEEPGLLLDSYPVLARNAKASLQIGAYEGDDLVTRMVSDASIMVNMTGLAGFLDRSGLMMLIPMGVLFGTVRDSSQVSFAEPSFEFIGADDHAVPDPPPEFFDAHDHEHEVVVEDPPEEESDGHDH